MSTYFDTSVLLKIYVYEGRSAEAVELIGKVSDTVPLSHLGEIELLSAIRQKYFRKQIGRVEMESALGAIKSDVLSGRLQRPDYDLAEVFHRAMALTGKYAASMGARSMDILHVAAALEIGCKKFVTFDARQRKMADKEGLQ